MKKIFSILVSLMIITLSFSSVFIAEEDDNVYTEGNIQYAINGDEASGYYITILYYYGTDSTYTIPWTIGVYEVKELADGAFTHSNVTTLKVPESITNINPSSYTDGTTIITYDAFDNETVITNHHRNPISDETDKLENEEIVNETIDSAFEDQTVTLTDKDFEDKQEDEGLINNIRRIINDSILFNGSLFASNFASNPIGFIIIGVSILGLIAVFIYIRRRR